MMMNDTLQLFDELLGHDPGSKIFFPLARLYRKQGQSRKAADIVLKGIEHHPDHLEAQLYLIELLHELGDQEAARTRAQSLFGRLSGYGTFWSILRTGFAASQRGDLALAALLVERGARNQGVDLLQILNQGLLHCQELTTSASAVSEPREDLDAEEVAQLCINSGIKTRTMAKLLIAQGEYEQAVAIYDDLIAAAINEQDRSELYALKNQARRHLGEQDPPTADKNGKLFQMLNSLASRLEEKAYGSSGKKD